MQPVKQRVHNTSFFQVLGQPNLKHNRAYNGLGDVTHYLKNIDPRHQARYQRGRLEAR